MHRFCINLAYRSSTTQLYIYLKIPLLCPYVCPTRKVSTIYNFLNLTVLIVLFRKEDDFIKSLVCTRLHSTCSLPYFSIGILLLGTLRTNVYCSVSEALHGRHKETLSLRVIKLSKQRDDRDIENLTMCGNKQLGRKPHKLD